ncbi:pre-mRNA-splicing factor CWC25 homolog [Euwallacea fornicatus]|uniref:pre-mRNA-splicing factor CWC25 homolog n=1 Tax=Euwallacea fornicatus TaxID=995702 RepID=UPI00338FDA8E
MGSEEKLDWIYKGANGLVDREEYLLGRKLDRTLEQINEEEKPNKIVLPTPKNHVEHECIPPSIRDFNKIVQAEQVDLASKLQEDPLVAIKKREEEARRQFLQNPVQLKKLQEALKKKEDLKKKHKKSKSTDLDEKIKEKLKNLKTFGTKKDSKKEKSDAMNTILMHKFNALKQKLSEKDLQDVLDGKVSSDSSEEEEEKKMSSSEEEQDRKSRNRAIQNKNRSMDQRYKEKKQNYQSGSRSRDYMARPRRNDSPRRTRHRSASRDYSSKRHQSPRRNERHYKSSTKRSRSRSIEKTKYYKRSNSPEHKNRDPKIKKKAKKESSHESTDDELNKKIMARLKLLREETEAKHQSTKTMLPEKPAHLKSTKLSTSNSSSSSDEDSGSENENPQKKSFGLVNFEGKKIAFKNEKLTTNSTAIKSSKKIQERVQNQRKNIKRMTEEEKERRRKEMILDAKVRDKERETSVKKYRETNRREEEMVVKKFDADAVHTNLLKSAKHTSVEQRIKSNLNNIQRSSKHMDQNFSKR